MGVLASDATDEQSDRKRSRKRDREEPEQPQQSEEQSAPLPSATSGNSKPEVTEDGNRLASPASWTTGAASFSSFMSSAGVLGGTGAVVTVASIGAGAGLGGAVIKKFFPTAAEKTGLTRRNRDKDRKDRALGRDGKNKLGKKGLGLPNLPGLGGGRGRGLPGLGGKKSGAGMPGLGSSSGGKGKGLAGKLGSSGKGLLGGIGDKLAGRGGKNGLGGAGSGKGSKGVLDKLGLGKGSKGSGLGSGGGSGRKGLLSGLFGGSGSKGSGLSGLFGGKGGKTPGLGGGKNGGKGLLGSLFGGKSNGSGSGKGLLGALGSGTRKAGSGLLGAGKALGRGAGKSGKGLLSGGKALGKGALGAGLGLGKGLKWSGQKAGAGFGKLAGLGGSDDTDGGGSKGRFKGLLGKLGRGAKAAGAVGAAAGWFGGKKLADLLRSKSERSSNTVDSGGSSGSGSRTTGGESSDRGQRGGFGWLFGRSDEERAARRDGTKAVRQAQRSGGNTMPNPFESQNEAVQASASKLEINRANDLIDWVQNAPGAASAQAEGWFQQSQKIKTEIDINPAFDEALSAFANAQRGLAGKMAEHSAQFEVQHAKALNDIRNPRPGQEKWDVGANNY